jgi:hypothetical protein
MQLLPTALKQALALEDSVGGGWTATDRSNPDDSIRQHQ